MNVWWIHVANQSVHSFNWAIKKNTQHDERNENKQSGNDLVCEDKKKTPAYSKENTNGTMGSYVINFKREMKKEKYIYICMSDLFFFTSTRFSKSKIVFTCIWFAYTEEETLFPRIDNNKSLRSFLFFFFPDALWNEYNEHKLSTINGICSYAALFQNHR